MNMKLCTALALVSLTVAGVACSEPRNQEDVTAAPQSETVSVDDEYAGSFNLSVPSTSASEDAGTGSLNLRLGQENESDGLLVGRTGLGGGNFQDAPQLELSLEDTEETPAAPQDPDDDIIRIEPKN